MCMRPEGKQLCMLSCVSGCEAADRYGVLCTVPVCSVPGESGAPGTGLAGLSLASTRPRLQVR